MNVLDLSQLSSSLTSTWDEVRADVHSHLLAFVLLFWFAGLPGIALPVSDEAVGSFRTTETYALLKDTGFLILTPLAVVLALLLYRRLLHLLGSLTIGVTSLFFGPGLRDYQTGSHPSTVSMFELIAANIENQSFKLFDLWEQLAVLDAKYRQSRPADYETFRKSLPSRDSAVYLSAFGAFLVLWALLWLIPVTAATLETSASLWRGFLALGVLWFWAFVRWRRWLLYLPVAQVLFVGRALSNEMGREAVREWSQSGRARVAKRRIQELLDEASRREVAVVSPIQLVLSRVWKRRDPDRGRPRGRPLSGIYAVGEHFEREVERRGTGWAWLRGYVAYVYFRTHLKLRVRSGRRWREFTWRVFGPKS